MKRRLFAVALALSMVVGLVAGCGGKEKEETKKEPEKQEEVDTSNVSDEDKFGGTLTIALASIASNIDPIMYTGVYEGQIIENIADTLIVYDNAVTDFEPSLATEWTANEAGDEYTFTLRDDVYFQPGKYQEGRKMTAEDVKYSLERSHNESALARLTMLDHCEVIDDTHVKCVLESPNASFLAALTNSGNVIVPKEEVEGWGDEFGAHLVGTGPFMMAENGWKTDQGVDLVKFDKFWGGDIYLDGLNFVYITEVNQRVNALKNGEVDIAYDLTGEGIEEIKADSNLKMIQEAGMGVNYIYFNMANGPTADIKVREALQTAVDREAMVSALYQYGEGQVGYLALPPNSWGYDESLIDIVPKYDVEKAKKLLAEAGYADGFELEYYTGDSATSKKIGEIFQQFCAQIGVTVNIHQAAWGTFSEIGASGNADVISMSWTWYPDPYFYLNKMFHEESLGTLGNGQQFNIPEVNELLDEAVAVSDQNERAELYKQALKLITEQYAQIDYSVANVNVGMSSKVMDFPVRPDKTIEVADGVTNNTWLAK
ncbi:ABC transporter substrate-binding protein [Roseburia hominis]